MVRIDVRRLAGDFECHGLFAGVDDVRACLVDDAQQLRTIVPRNRNLNQGEVACDGRDVTKVFHLQHVDELVQIRRHAIGADLVAVDHDGHTRDPGHVRTTDGERFDVERPPPEQRRDAIEHAGLVFDQRH